ncbi:ABC transporter ATP-binding protein [Jiangella asiatica]|uniref:ABC transporter ATP-binding protein n=1 Tax=Jiangella asiatica TaxID=2530372 RepID=UPI00193DEE9E|nr:ABC transporter ATP-binding protein [Jiangella asiatica]
MEPVLRIEDLRVEVRLRDSVVRAVDGVSIHLRANEMLGIVGESGCGKTMTALSVMRMLPPRGRIAGGSIRLAGKELTALTDAEMRHVRGNDVGMIFQDPFTSLNPTMSIGRQIARAARLHRGLSRAEAAERATDLLELVGLPHARQRFDDYPHQCSGGIRQRVMIAMALSREPKVLIADEPTTALDVSIQHQILDLIDDLRQRLGMAVLLVSHDLGVVAGRADRVAVMYAGKVAESGDTDALFAAPRHPYTEALFEALPERAAATRTPLYTIPGMPPGLARPLVGCRFAPRCRYAEERCTVEEPPLAVALDGRRHACFHPVGDPPQPLARPAAGAPQVPTVADDAAAAVPLLSVLGLVKDYPLASGAMLRRREGTVSAVADVTFDVHRGETFGLVGESGCGKTTIGRLIVGLEKPTRGSIELDGEELTTLKGAAYRRARRDIQLMFQDSSTSMDPRMRIAATLREPLAVQRVGNLRERRHRIEELLGKVGLPAAALHRYPHEFSGGQRQLLSFARALTLMPKLVVTDEPVSAMDMSVQAHILNLMRDLQHDLGLTYLFISHDLAVVRYLSDRIGVMYLGKIVEVGPAEEVYRNPAHPYTKGLVDSAPVADPVIERQKLRSGIKGELPSAIDPPSGCRFRTRCEFAQDVCAEVEPPARPFGPGGHVAACHFPLARPAGVTASPAT